MTTTSPDMPPDHQLAPTTSTQLTFHLAGPHDEYGLRPVSQITTLGQEILWRHGDTGARYYPPLAPPPYSEETFDLPYDLSERLLDFARRYVGPNGTIDQAERFCHEFASEVGRTATWNHREGRSLYRSIVTKGQRISSAELRVGEHGAIDDPSYQPPFGDDKPAHSLVGLGHGWAVQLNGGQRALYVGKPDDFINGLRGKGGRNDPGLYVRRDPVPDPVQSARRRSHLLQVLRRTDRKQF